MTNAEKDFLRQPFKLGRDYEHKRITYDIKHALDNFLCRPAPHLGNLGRIEDHALREAGLFIEDAEND
jgi:hypothetical protein